MKELVRLIQIEFCPNLKLQISKTLKITGGEPFSHPDIDNFLFKAIQCHFETIILTNALLLNKQRIDMIKKGHIQLGISLDGMTSDTHDFIRGKGAFDKLIRILKILSLEDIKFSITCTINKKNLCQIDENNRLFFEMSLEHKLCS